MDENESREEAEEGDGGQLSVFGAVRLGYQIAQALAQIPKHSIAAQKRAISFVIRITCRRLEKLGYSFDDIVDLLISFQHALMDFLEERLKEDQAREEEREREKADEEFLRAVRGEGSGTSETETGAK